jgi:hypothetical protein
LREEFLDEAKDTQAVRRMLDTLLAPHPEMLYDARRSALARHAMILPAESLPVVRKSHEAPPSSNRYHYGILPVDLNSWEQHCAQVLDPEQSGAMKCPRPMWRTLHAARFSCSTVKAAWSGGWCGWMPKKNGQASVTSRASRISRAGDCEIYSRAPQTTITSEGTLEFEFDSPGNAAFHRVLA